MNEFIVISVCLLLNALFAAFEMAFVAVSKPELNGLAKKGNKDAEELIHMRSHPERTLSVIQLGLTFSSALAAAVGGMGIVHKVEPYFMEHFRVSESVAKGLGLIVFVTPLTYISVVFGELVPKTLALRHPTKIVLLGAKSLFWLDRTLSPIVAALEWSTKKFLDIVFRRAKLPTALPEATIEISELSPVHQRFMLNMATIEKKSIKDILVPWEEVNVIHKTDSIAEVANAFVTSAHTRLPVLDNNRVFGVLNTKEFIILKEAEAESWHSIIRQVLKVKSTDSALGVLRLMQENRQRMCIVFSPFGERMGVVTLEDIWSVIIGDIYDEDDDGIVRRVFASRARNKIMDI